MTQMTPEEYMAKDACACPFCGSPNIRGEYYEGAGTNLTQSVYCVDCSKDWIDIYEMKTYMEVV